MATFYDWLGLPPDAPPEQIEAAVAARLAHASGDERELGLRARDTLLDPSSRASYNRILGLATVSPNEELARMRAALGELHDQGRLVNQRRDAELLFALYAALVGAVLATWVAALRWAVPLLQPGLAWLAGLRGLEAHTDALGALIVTLPLAALAWLALNIVEHALHRAGRVFAIIALVSGTMAALIRLFGLNGIVGYGLFMGGALVMRWIAERDLHEQFGPGSSRKR